MPQKPVRAQSARKKKGGNKNPNLTLNRAIARRDAAQAVIDQLNGQHTAQAPRRRDAEDDKDGSDSETRSAASEAEKRMVISYFWKTECNCACEEEWSGRDGNIAFSRRSMGSSAPSIPMVRRTLHRLAEGDENVYASKRGGSGRPRTLTNVDDLYIGLLLCDGLSQVQVTLMLNAERREQGLPELTRLQIQDAEYRVQLKRRRSRKHKSESCDLESNWCKAAS